MKRPAIIYKFYGLVDDYYALNNTVIPSVGHTIQIKNRNWIVQSVRHYLEPHENCIRIVCLPFND